MRDYEFKNIYIYGTERPAQNRAKKWNQTNKYNRNKIKIWAKKNQMEREK